MMAQSDPFAAVRINKQAASSSQVLENKENASEDPFSNVRVAKPDEEGWGQWLKRQSARTSSRLIETVLGLPGDVESLASSGILGNLEKIHGIKTPKGFEKKKKAFPSSQRLQEISEEFTGGYTTPRGKAEKTADEFIKTFAQFLGPKKFGMGFRKALGGAAVGTAAKEGLGVAGFDPKTQEAGKLGSIILFSLVNPKGMQNLIRSSYDKAHRLVPEGTLVSGKPLELKLNNLKKELSKGTLAPSEKVVFDEVEKILPKIRDGKIDVNEFMSVKRSLNERAGDPALFTRGEHKFPELQKAVDGAIKLYHNPEFIRAYRSANEVYGGFAESKKLSNFITKTLQVKPLKHTALTLLVEGMAGHPEFIGPTIATLGAGKAMISSYELLNRISSNPTLRDYYINALKDAARQNAKGVLTNLTKLDDALIKEDQK